MICCGKTWALVCGGVLLSCGVRAVTPDLTGNPFSGIVERNVFQLKDAPVVPIQPVQPALPPVKITLTGITTILGNKRALMKAAIPARPPEPAKEESYMLAEGQRDGGIEVVAIDEKASIVKVNNNGVAETLDFDKNGAKLTASAAAFPVPQPGMVPPPAGIPAPPPMAASGGLRSIPTRNGHSGQEQAAGQPVGGPGGIEGGAGSFNPNNPATTHFTGSISPEEQTVAIEAQRLRMLQQGQGEGASMLPTTEMTDQVVPPAQ